MIVYEKLVESIKQGDDKAFFVLLEQFKPLITKYSNLLFKEEFEDMKSEFTLALWQAVLRIKLLNNDYQIISYIANALRLRFLELYKKSRKHHDNEVLISNDSYFSDIIDSKPVYNNLITQIDIDTYLSSLKGSKKTIAKYILKQHFSDIEISKALNISRQYVNRIRREIKNYLKKVMIYD